MLHGWKGSRMLCGRLSERIGRTRAHRARVALTLAVAALLSSGSAQAATYVRVTGGTVKLPATAWTLDNDVYLASGCPADVTDGNVAAVLDVSSYGGKWLQIRFDGADLAFGSAGLSARGESACEPPFGGTLTFSQSGFTKYTFKVAEEHHVVIYFTGVASGVRYSLWRCTTTSC